MRQMRQIKFLNLVFVNPYKFRVYKIYASMRHSSLKVILYK